MRKWKILFFVSVLTIALAACGNDSNSGEQGGQNQGDNQQSGGQNGGQSGDQNNSQNGGQSSDQNGSQNNGQSGDQNGSQGGGQNGGQDGEQSGGELSESMQSVKDALVETLGDNYWPETAIPADLLEDKYGISPDMYDDYLAEMPLMSTKVDTIIVVQAKEDSVNDVEDALTKYRDKVINDTLQYPMNIGKVQASRIERIGNYVCFVQLGGDTMDAMDIGDEEVIKHCQEQNELAITIIEQNVQH